MIEADTLHDISDNERSSKHARTSQKKKHIWTEETRKPKKQESHLSKQRAYIQENHLASDDEDAHPRQSLPKVVTNTQRARPRPSSTIAAVPITHKVKTKSVFDLNPVSLEDEVDDLEAMWSIPAEEVRAAQPALPIFDGWNDRVDINKFNDCMMN